MTYKESYMKCDNLEELQKEIQADRATAMTIGNTDRIDVIKKTAEEVCKIKKF